MHSREELPESSKWSNAVEALLAVDVANKKTPPTEDLVYLGGGLYGSVFGLDDLAIKIFRLRDGFPDGPNVMYREISTYKYLSQHKVTVLPHLFAHDILGVATAVGEITGWAVYSRVSGKTWSALQIESLPQPQVESWAKSVGQSIADFESELGKVPPLLFWNQASQVRARLSYIHDHAQRPEDFRIAGFLEAKLEVAARRSFVYTHGDLQPNNIMINGLEDGSPSAKLIDPVVAFEDPASNFRHYVHHQKIGGPLIDAYEKSTGKTVNLDLAFAFGAITQLRNLVAAELPERQDSDEAERRRNALARCMANLHGQQYQVLIPKAAR